MSSLLNRAIEAHGGASRWQAIRAVEADFSVGGGLWERKGWPDVLKSAHAVAQVHEQNVRYQAFIKPDQQSLFTPGYVAIYDNEGRVRMDREEPGKLFVGHGFATAWDELHLAYFTGYAIWNYLTAPFLFAEDGFASRELDPWQEGAETWQRLQVTFPPHISTHCREQVFYFNQDNLLRRMDYSSEITNSGTIAHYMSDHKTFDGIVVPTRRRAMFRNDDGTPKAGPASVAIDFHELAFR